MNDHVSRNEFQGPNFCGMHVTYLQTQRNMFLKISMSTVWTTVKYTIIIKIQTNQNSKNHITSLHRIIGLYVSVVLVIGSALRTYVAQLPSKINIDEIPDPDSLLELCDDIFYVREDGQLQEEEILVGRLFFTFRSSVRLMAETRWKQD